MTLQEKKIYHQIHPFKLFTDFATAFLAVYLLWEHYLILAICIAFIPSTLVSLWLIAKVDLEKYKNSAFGTYLRRHLASKLLDWIRFAGFAVMLVGGWNQWMWCVGFGFAIVLACWLNGLVTTAFSKRT